MIVYKGYQIKPHKAMPTALVIATEGQGGKIPSILEGLFTSSASAKTAIDFYIETKVKKKNETISEI